MIQAAWLRFLYPPHCPGCQAAVRTHGVWCADCYATIWHPRLIRGSRKEFLDGCYALGDYRGPLRQALIDLKFHGKLSQTAAFSRLLEEFPWPERWRRITMVLGVPISAQRKKERGFDQTEEIFRDFFLRRGIGWREGLRKVRHTLPQSGLQRAERAANIKHSFTYEGVLFSPYDTVLLVDDIYTTGCTMREAARVLHRAGAGRIVGLVIASGAD